VTVGPGPQREQAGRFTQTVADHGVGANAEATRCIAYQTAQRDLAKNTVAHGRRCTGAIVPEDIRDILTTQVAILGVLTAKNLRPVNGKLTAHAGIIVARSGEDEGDTSRSPQR